MHWENLHANRCPYCGDNLLDNGVELECTTCVFHILPERAESIVRHRMKWQNLLRSQCPICQSMLLEEEKGRTVLLKCLTPECPFIIREDRLKEILADPNHKANVWAKIEEERNAEIDRELENI